MKRILFTMLTALLGMGLYAQVGIGTQDPKASLDIVANTVSPTANGLLIPRLTATQVQAMETQVGTDQNALLVYVTATFTATPTDVRYTDIYAIGYYYWDATDNAPNGKWKKLGNYTAGAGIEIGSNTISATGLEKLTEGGNTGYRIIGRNPDNYGNIGKNAVDLSYHTYSSTTLGATGESSIAMGYGTTASGIYSTAMGYYTSASGGYSFAMGSNNTASGWFSVAMGGEYVGGVNRPVQALGRTSFAFGRWAEAKANHSIVMGWGINPTLLTKATAEFAIAMGVATTASGTASTAMGMGTTALGEYSVAMGGELFGSDIKPATALGKTSLAFGRYVEAQADYSIAMGWGESASELTKATGEYAIAMGYGTTASGRASTAMGDNTTASGIVSTAMGKETIASANYSTAMGLKANTGSNLILVVGNGENIFGVDKNGSVYAKGTFYPFGISNVSDGRLKKDVAPLPSASATLAKLRPVQYHWNAEAKAQGNDDTRLQYGFIAQEVEEVLPFLVDEHPTLRDENKMIKSLNYTGIIPVLTKVLQEKSAIVDEQQSEIEVLKAQLQAEKARNDQQEAQLQSQEARLKAIEAKLK